MGLAARGRTLGRLLNCTTDVRHVNVLMRFEQGWARLKQPPQCPPGNCCHQLAGERGEEGREEETEEGAGRQSFGIEPCPGPGTGTGTGISTGPD